MGKNKKERRLFRIINPVEMREHKAKTIAYFVLRILVIGIMIYNIVCGHFESAMTCVLTLILFLIPSFIETKMKIDVPDVLEVILISFVFAANIMGELGSFYERVPFWDTMLHTLNGFICAAVGFGLIDILNRNDKVKISLSPLFVCLFSFCFSMTVGVIWEFFEFSMDYFVGMDMQKDTVVDTINSVLLTGGLNEITTIDGVSETLVNGENLGIDGYLDIGIIDTMKDLFVNFIGAVVFNFAGFFYLIGRSKRSGFIDNFVPTKIKDF